MSPQLPKKNSPATLNFVPKIDNKRKFDELEQSDSDDNKLPLAKKKAITTTRPLAELVHSASTLLPVEKRIAILSVPLATVQDTLKLLRSSTPTTTKTKNQYLTPVIRSLVNTDLKFDQDVDKMGGHCFCLYTR